MKKTYMTPASDVIRIEKVLLTQASLGYSNETVSNESDLLGHGDDGDWEDEEF